MLRCPTPAVVPLVSPLVSPPDKAEHHKSSKTNTIRPKRPGKDAHHACHRQTVKATVYWTVRDNTSAQGVGWRPGCPLETPGNRPAKHKKRARVSGPPPTP